MLGNFDLKSPIRILHMIAVLEMGGTQSMIMNLYRVIDRSKVQFDFIIDHPDKDNELRDEIESLGGRIYSFPTFNGKNIHEEKRTWDEFLTEHKEYKVLHTHSRSYASIYLPIAKKHGLITIAHSHSTSNGKGVAAIIKDFMQFPIRYQADYMFACSKEAGEWLFGKKIVKSEKFKVIPNAIDSKLFAYSPEKRKKIRKELGITSSYVIGHVGRISKPKNHHFLLKCFKEIQRNNQNTVLLLVGDGELSDEIKNEASQLGIQDRVVFLGSRTNTYDYYQAMDCFVFPSLWEGLGIAVVEAQASGLPCIVSDTVPRSVDIGAGLVEFLSLSVPLSFWMELINENYTERKDTTELVVRAGYDIKENAERMQKFYEDIWK